MTCTSVGSWGSIVRFGLSAFLILANPHPLLLPPLLLLLANLPLAHHVLLLPPEAEVKAATNFSRSLGFIPGTANSARIAAKEKDQSLWDKYF